MIVPAYNFPDPASVPIITGRSRRYRTPLGDMVSVTAFLNVLGLGKEGLIRWSATIERNAVLEACGDVFAEFDGLGPDEFVDAVSARLGKARQHQKALDAGAEIGTFVHQQIQHRINVMLGMEMPAPPMPDDPQKADKVLWSVMAWEDWWRNAGLTPYRTEQPVYDGSLLYAGTIDLLAFDSDGRLGIVDLKTSKAIYDDHHLQVAAYMHAARNWAPIGWGKIIRVPKRVDDPEFEVRTLGEMYDRKLTEEQLMIAVRAARAAWGILVGKD